MTHADTGTGPTRRRLTEAEAQAGIPPAPFTREEWDKMHVASAAETTAKHYRLALAWAVRRRVL